ncbi:MAG: hypothetical protein RLZZ232_3109 [Planctomycetota bacterium]
MQFRVFDQLRDEARLVQLPEGRNPIRIGRDVANDIVLNSNLVAAKAGMLINEGDGSGWKFRPLTDDWRIADRDLVADEAVPVSGNQTLQCSTFQIDFEFSQPHATESERDRRRILDGESASVINSLHSELLAQLERGDASGSVLPLADHEQPRSEYVLKIEQLISELADRDSRLNNDFVRTAVSDHLAGLAFRSRLVRFVVSGQWSEQDRSDNAVWHRNLSKDPNLERTVEIQLGTFTTRLDLDKPRDISAKMQTLEKEFWPSWKMLSPQFSNDLVRYLSLCQIRREIKDMMFGLGPLEELLENPTVTEIMVNDADSIFIEKDGSIENSGRRFARNLGTVIHKIVSRVQRKIDTSDPMVDARLSDGSRVNVVIAPLTVRGPCLTIRRFPRDPLSNKWLVGEGAISSEASEFLRSAVVMRCNILVAGGTGTGKTTLLNALSSFIPEKERIITIEDTAELRIPRGHVVSLETRMKNVEGKGAVDIRMLMKNALRMRPDRIIVGECRGGEALDMLQAMNTGHDGSMTTLHANSPSDVISRLEVMVQQNGDTVLPVSSIHQQISSAVDLIVQLSTEIRENPATGSRSRRRFVSAITEVAEADSDVGGVYLKDIFRLTRAGVLRPTGCFPSFIEKLISEGGMRLENLLLDETSGIH